MDPGPARHVRLARRRAACCRTRGSASIVLLAHRRVLDVLALGDEEAGEPRRERRAACGCSSSRRRRSARRRRSRSAGLIGFVGDHRPALRSGSRSAAATGWSCRSRCSSAAASSSSRTCRADGDVAGRAADRRRHGVLRRAVLRDRAAHEPAGHRDRDRARRRLGLARRARRSSTASRTTSSQGEWLTLIGPNGAGKSTLLRAVRRARGVRRARSRSTATRRRAARAASSRGASRSCRRRR